MAHSRVGEYTVITTAGDLDVETAAALRDAIGVVVEAGQRQVVVDLDAVDFLDSAGLGVLIGGMTFWSVLTADPLASCVGGTGR
jgi:anti-sigma B factor antagonist